MTEKPTRSSGCFGSEVRLQCPLDSDATLVIENATFYHIPFLAINCSRGQLGPLAIEGDPGFADAQVRKTFFPTARMILCTVTTNPKLKDFPNSADIFAANAFRARPTTSIEPSLFGPL